jgi:sulfur relay (sulfurtransferase) DsrF/TusC family protein
MTNYIFIESRDPFESRDMRFVVETATALRQGAHTVTVFLIQNGAFAARRRARHSHIPELVAAGIRVLADDFSLRERGIAAVELCDGIQETTIEALVDLLARDDAKVIWH